MSRPPETRGVLRTLVFPRISGLFRIELARPYGAAEQIFKTL